MPKAPPSDSLSISATVELDGCSLTRSRRASLAIASLREFPNVHVLVQQHHPTTPTVIATLGLTPEQARALATALLIAAANQRERP